QLEGPVIWIDYGNIPKDLSGRKMMRTPSWVALEDVDRQRVERGEIEARLRAWREFVEKTPGLYLISFDRLDRVPVWDRYAGDFELVRDYRDEFKSLRQIVAHWYGSGDPPRYLYRRIEKVEVKDSHADPHAGSD